MVFVDFGLAPVGSKFAGCKLDSFINLACKFFSLYYYTLCPKNFVNFYIVTCFLKKNRNF